MVTRREWVRAFLMHRNDPTTESNIAAVLTWIRSEFGSAAPIPAHWNPMATTRDAAGATLYNHAGVRSYPNMATGVAALSDTLDLDEPGYAAIRSALTQGQEAIAVVDAVHASAWGSKPTASLLAYVYAHESQDAALDVGDDAQVIPEPVGTPTPAWPGTLLRNRTDDHGTATWQAQMAHRGWTIAVDDIFGPQCERVARAFQAEKGLEVDGIVGPITWAAAWTEPIT